MPWQSCPSGISRKIARYEFVRIERVAEGYRQALIPEDFLFY
jgi:hypothetical protein